MACCVPGWQNCAMVCCVPDWLYFLTAVALEAYSWVALFRCAKAVCFLFVKAVVLPALFVLAGEVKPVLLKAC